MLFTGLQLQLLTTHLAVELSIQKDVPSGKVPVDKVLAGEVSHPICNLPGELQQKGSGVGVLRRAGGGAEGAETVVGMCLLHVAAAGALLTAL